MLLVEWLLGFGWVVIQTCLDDIIEDLDAFHVGLLGIEAQKFLTCTQFFMALLAMVYECFEHLFIRFGKVSVGKLLLGEKVHELVFGTSLDKV